MHLACPDFFLAAPADAGQFVTEFFALRILAVIGPVLSVHACKYTRGQHGGGKPRAFLVGPVGHDNRVFGFDTEIIERADNFQPAENTQNPVVFSARGLRIQM